MVRGTFKLGVSSDGPESSDPKNRVSRHIFPINMGALKRKNHIKLINFLIWFFESVLRDKYSGHP